MAAERVCSWAIPVLGVLVVAATCWLGVLLRDWLAGLAAALLASILPPLVARSSVGRVDHDIAVILASALAFACCALGLRSRSLTPRVAMGLAGGALLAWSLWAWPGSILFVPVVPAAFAIRVLQGRSAEDASVVVPMMVVACLGTVAQSLGGPAILSQAHLLVAAFCALSPILGLVVASRCGQRLLPRAVLLVLGHAALAAAALLVLVGAPQEFRFLASFAAGRADTVVAQAGEARPLFSRGWVPAVRHVTWAAAALPPAALLLLWRAVHSRASLMDWVLLSWLAVTAAAALLQQRFAAYLAVPMALVLGAALTWLWSAARAATSEARPILRWGAAAALLAGACLPSDSTRWSPPLLGAELPRVLPALDWLAVHAPAGDVTDFITKPSHSVAAHWHYGHWLTCLGGQANVADPFGNAPQHQLGLDRVRRIFGAATEQEAAASCREAGARFVLSTDTFLPAVLIDLYGSVYGTPPCFASALQSQTPPSIHFALRKEWTQMTDSGRLLKTRVFEVVSDSAPPSPSPSPPTVE
jgi:asparagine N-glycosylation enzyme membrane subunit Stt3